jgi:hypothetical protein
MVIATEALSAPAGTVTVALPLKAVALPPAGPTKPPGPTVMVAVALFPSLVAVMVALPAATAVTTPLPSTVAKALALDPQVTPRPVSVLPNASFAVATKVTVWTGTSDALLWFSVTVATGTTTASTVMVAVALRPSLVAVITAVPTATAVTRPDPLTVAIPAALDAQLIVLPESAAPDASFVVATSVTVCCGVRVAALWFRVTVATDAGGAVVPSPPLPQAAARTASTPDRTMDRSWDMDAFD